MIHTEEKRKYNKVVKKHIFGYFDNELTHNVKDWKQSFDYTVDQPTTFPISGDPSDKRLTNDVCEDNAKKMKKLTFRLMELIGLSLVLPTNRFASYSQEHTSYLQFNSYPPYPFADLALGVVEGLEMKRKSDEKWVKVKSIPNAFIINIRNNIYVPPFKLFQSF
ncbi:unnamed protein product [Malus baccata var. baccata]